MKKMVTTAAIAVFASATTAAAFIGLGSFLIPNIPSNAYAVESIGLNVRVYEFQSQSDPDQMCAMAFGSERPVGLTCWKTEAEVVPNVGTD